MLEAFESREGGRRRGGLGGGRRGGKNSSAVSVEVGGENGESAMEYLRGDRETGERNDKIKRWDGDEGISSVEWLYSAFAEGRDRGRGFE